MLSFAFTALLAGQTANADATTGLRTGVCVGMDPSCVYSALQLEVANQSMTLGASFGPDQLGLNGRAYLFPRSRLIRPHLSFGISTTTADVLNSPRTTENSLLIDPELIVAPGIGIDYHFGPGNNFILRPHAAVGIVSMNDTLYDYIGGSVSLMVNFDGQVNRNKRTRRRIRRRR